MDRHRIKIDRAETTADRLVRALRAAGLRPARPIITGDGDDVGFDVAIGWHGAPGSSYVRAMAGRIELTGGEPYRVLATSDDWWRLECIVAAARETMDAAKPESRAAPDPYGYDREGAYHGD